MPEESTQASEETKSVGTDAESKLQAEIQNAIKLRKRAQDAETELERIKADAEKVKEAELKEQGRLAELLEKREAELAVKSERAAAYDKYEAERRAQLLALLPEDQHELVDEMSLAKLEKYVVKQNGDKPQLPPNDVTKPRKGAPEKRYSECKTPAEKKQWLLDHQKR